MIERSAAVGQPALRLLVHTIRYDSLMAMGNFDETAKELPRSPKVKNTIFLSTKSISYLVSVKLAYSIELRELE